MTNLPARRFTGRRFLAIMVICFGIIIAVNITMATFATRTFPGLIVENSYVASQNFNEWLEAGRAQKALGWTVKTVNEGGMLVIEASSALDQPLTGLVVEATMTHPLGAEPAQTLKLNDLGGGRYAAGPLPHGQWIAEIRLHRGGERYYLKKRLTGA